MDIVYGFYFAHPFWVWLAIGAVFLTVEVATGSGYLLWPAASALVVAVVTVFAHLGLAVEVVVFAVLTLTATFLAKRYLPNPFRPTGPDINDTSLRLVGHHGRVAHAFKAGRGRVFVDGKEWAAELEGDGALDNGAAISVVGVAGGALLRVRAD
jgi:membrane protein implicated in regulation of membrane protease activity